MWKVFKQAAFSVKVNLALSKLWIDPTKLVTEYRQSLQEIAFNSGVTPEAVAVFIAVRHGDELYLDVPEHQILLATRQIVRWTDEGKSSADAIAMLEELV